MDYPIHELPKDKFPSLLMEIPDTPKQLYYRGELPSTTARSLAVVGSRNYTTYGKQCVEHLLGGLRGYPISIISGLALGIDALAHKAALSAGLYTLAVPGSGLDDRVLYPARNRGLASEILQAGGGLLSEFEPDFQATTWSFPARNRIMAGLAHAVLIIEATEKSGTLITARLGTEYNRDVLAVPNSIFSDHAMGPHMLIKLGATPVTSPEDILEALNIEKEAQKETVPEDLSPIEQKILEALSEPRDKDELIRIAHASAPELNAILSLMEIKDLISIEMNTIRKK